MDGFVDDLDLSKAWTCHEMYGFLDDLNLVVEATFATVTLVAPPATESWMAAPPTSQGATADVPGELS